MIERASQDGAETVRRLRLFGKHTESHTPEAADLEHVAEVGGQLDRQPQGDGELVVVAQLDLLAQPALDDPPPGQPDRLGQHRGAVGPAQGARAGVDEAEEDALGGGAEQGQRLAVDRQVEEAQVAHVAQVEPRAGLGGGDVAAVVADDEGFILLQHHPAAARDRHHVSNAECGMRNAESRGREARCRARPVVPIPHSAFVIPH